MSVHVHIVIYIHMYIHAYIYRHTQTYVLFFILLSISVFSRILNIVPCAIQQDLIVYFIYNSLYLLIPNS